MKALAVGCSYTKGHGLDLEISDPRLWTNRLLQYIAPDCKITNLSMSGKNNHWIFTEACTALIQNEYDIVLIGWTEQARLNFTVGLEKYQTDSMLNNLDINVNPGITVTGKQLQKIGNSLRVLQNDHWALLDVIKYVNILYDAQVKNRGKTLIFVNSILNVSDNYFVEKDFEVPSELTEYQQQILNVDTRSDQEVKEIYHMTHQHYRHYGGIKPNCWLNLYCSLNSMKVDTISSTDLHPGYRSQDVYVKYLIDQFNETNNNNN